MANMWCAQGSMGMNQDAINTSNSSGTTNPNPSPNNEVTDIEIFLPRRRPRGRPPGSKNKPRAPIPIPVPNAAHPTNFIQIAAGSDIFQSLADIARSRQVGVSVSSASGRVSNVTLRQPNGVFTVTGICEIISLSGAFLPSSISQPGYAALNVSLAGNQGKVFGGPVVGTLIASGPVVIVVNTFTNANFERVPLQDAGDGMQSQPPPAAVAEPSNLGTNGGMFWDQADLPPY
ncbi:AT-hook motif nuclear-localized protein 20-like [Salvia hispanica]|uniref:AT-hook motif nuclear-localized protein 20-like n=1 Tax=Salvia hispanica TaxID=49212 RepID=UPI0020092D11|nr:AT-hook motif nuclear-localized protein 20-like [Salvia hispanica]